jgi:iron complex transport system substrate-binding protein
VRVVTLLPGATEIVAALGAVEQLVGRSHECDWPPAVAGIPSVTTTPIAASLPSGAIDAAVRAAREAGRPVIAVDARRLAELAPDVVVTQELCEVCAVADGEARRLAAVLERPPEVVGLSGRTLDGVYGDIRRPGRALGREAEADALVARMRARLAALPRPAVRRRVVCVEWLDPPCLAGHWTPELVAAAGGEDVGARAGEHSRRATWTEIAGLAPELVVVMLCGFGVERSLAELARCGDAEALALFRRVPTWVLDGNAYTSRPGPRLVEGAERIAAALAGREMPGLARPRAA